MPALVAISIALLWRDGSLLVGRRPERSIFGGFDEFPGGKVEPGETHDQAVVRECLEETGLAVVIRQPRLTVLSSDPSSSRRLTIFDCLPISQVHPVQPPWRWVPFADVFSLRFPPANRLLLATLKESGPWKE